MDKNIRRVQTENKETGIVVLNRVTNVIFSLVEIILGFRLVFKMLGANPANGFVKAVYAVTKPVVSLFSGIFDNISLGGEAPEKVLELDTIIAIIVIAIIAWMIQSLIYPRIRNRTEQTEYIEPEHQDNNPTAP